MDMNIQHADCLKSVSDFGQTTVHNICSGAVSVVPWGTADWALAVLLTGFGLGILALLFGMAATILFDRF